MKTRAAVQIGLLIMTFLISGCGDIKTPTVNTYKIIDMTPGEFFRRFNEQMPDSRLKLREPEVTKWGANQQPLWDSEIRAFPQSFYSTPPTAVGVLITCNVKSQKIWEVTVFATIDGKNDFNLPAATFIYRTAIRVINPRMNNGDIEGILNDLKVNELPPEYKNRETSTQRDFGKHGVTTNFEMSILQQDVGERIVSLTVYNTEGNVAK